MLSCHLTLAQLAGNQFQQSCATCGRSSSPDQKPGSMVSQCTNGSCQIAATFCEIPGNPGTQNPLGSSWGSCTDEPQAPLSTNALQGSNAAVRANKHPSTPDANTRNKAGKTEPSTPQYCNSGKDRPKLCSHQNIHLTERSSEELRLLMQDLEHLAEASSKRGMPSSLNP